MKKLLNLSRKSIIILTSVVTSIIVLGIVIFVVVNNVMHNNKSKELCTVYFDSRGGTEITSSEITCGTTLTIVNNPSKEGFSFIGWYLEDEIYDFTKPIESNIVLTAQYIMNDNVSLVVVKFDSNGGTNVMDIESVKGSSITPPLAPMLIGYKFVGWYLGDSLFDFNTLINDDITLKAKWEKDTSGNNDNNGWISGNNGNDISQVGTNKYKCTGAFYKEITEKKITIGQVRLLNSIWSTGMQYVSNDNECYITYKSSDTSIATINDIGDITAIKKGKTTVSQCLNDTETKTELGCFKGILNVSGASCEYTLSPHYSSDGGEEMFYTNTKSPWSYDSYLGSYSSDGCKLVYKSDDSSIAVINEDRMVEGKSIGTTNLSSCLVEKDTGKTLICYTVKARVFESGSDQQKRSEKFVNSILGTYWYLDGYKNAYIHPYKYTYSDGSTSLLWDSNYIGLVGNQFVASEDTNMNYLSSDIDSAFSSRPIEFAYEVMEKYNMNVKNNKLYITIGGKTYSFYKKNSAANVTAKVTFNTDKVTIDEWGSFSISAQVSPLYVEHSISDITYDKSIMACNQSFPSQSGRIDIQCFSLKDGVTDIVIKEEHSGYTSSVNVVINNVPIYVNEVKLNKTRLDIAPNESYQLSATISPDNADNANIAWSSSDPSVVSVDNTGKVVALKEGEATITVKTVDGRAQASCMVNVRYTSLGVGGTLKYVYVDNEDGTQSKEVHGILSVSGGSGDYTIEYVKIYLANAAFYHELASSNYGENIAIYRGPDHGKNYYDLLCKVKDNVTGEVKEHKFWNIVVQE